MTDDWSARSDGSRDDLNEGVVPRTEPRFGSHGSGPRANIYKPRGSRHRSNASGRWCWIAIWPARTRLIGLRQVSSWSGRGNRSPHQRGIPPLSSRHLRLLVDGMGRPTPRCSSAPTPKRSSGCAGASTRTEIIPSRIFLARLPWRGSASWIEARATVQAGLALDPRFTIRRFRSLGSERAIRPFSLGGTRVAERHAHGRGARGLM